MFSVASRVIVSVCRGSGGLVLNYWLSSSGWGGGGGEGEGARKKNKIKIKIWTNSGILNRVATTGMTTHNTKQHTYSEAMHAFSSHHIVHFLPQSAQLLEL